MLEEQQVSLQTLFTAHVDPVVVTKAGRGRTAHQSRATHVLRQQAITGFKGAECSCLLAGAVDGIIRILRRSRAQSAATECAVGGLSQIKWLLPALGMSERRFLSFPSLGTCCPRKTSNLKGWGEGGLVPTLPLKSPAQGFYARLPLRCTGESRTFFS